MKLLTEFHSVNPIALYDQASESYVAI